MRRAMALLLSVATIVGMVAGQVFADSGPARTASGLTVRSDPNEKDILKLDIRRVMTHLGTDEVLFRVGIWRAGGFNSGEVTINLDTTGTSDFDYLIEVISQCLVEPADGFSIIGKVAARHPGPRDILCRVPTVWLTIDKPVRFVVRAFGGQFHDRAPDRGDYFGL